MARKVIVWSVLAAAVMVLGGATPARADETVVANVPFGFIVGKLRMPAGQYTVTQLDDQRAIVSVASADRRYFTFVLTNAVAPQEAGPEPELVFKHVGENYFLERVVAGDFEAREIPLTPAIMRREGDRVAVAVIPASGIRAAR